MAKFSAKLAVVTGYEEMLDEGMHTGVEIPTIVEYPISGDLLMSSSRNRSDEHINEAPVISNRFSFLASPKLLSFIGANMTNSIYIVWMNMRLKVSEIDLNQMPRVIITTDGMWNGIQH